MAPDPDLMRGTLDTILLEVISRRPMYGYEICKAVNTRTQGYFDLREGSLYPALHRLERDGYLKSYWEQTDAGRRRKYYQITDSGSEVLACKRNQWREFAGAIERVLTALAPSQHGNPGLEV
jgi:PadR family transcriptional regulator, regulatory protein PadR